jgi:hypothetical protein
MVEIMTWWDLGRQVGVDLRRSWSRICVSSLRDLNVTIECASWEAWEGRRIFGQARRGQKGGVKERGKTYRAQNQVVTAI